MFYQSVTSDPFHAIDHFLYPLKTSENQKKCPYLEFFWSIFLYIWAEYAEIRSSSLRIQFECVETRTRKTPNTETFHAVHLLIFFKLFVLTY